MADDMVTFARGDVGGLIEVLRFLGSSADHAIRSEALDAIPPGAALTLTRAVAEDGLDPEVDLGDAVTVIHMVSGRVERRVLLAYAGQSGLNVITYVVEGPKLHGRLYRNAQPEFVFLEHEVRTGDRHPVFVTGNTEYLGSWDPERALPLSFGGFGPGGFHWSIRIPLRPGDAIEFKFIKKVTVWETGENRRFTAGNQNATTSDNFRIA